MRSRPERRARMRVLALLFAAAFLQVTANEPVRAQNASAATSKPARTASGSRPSEDEIAQAVAVIRKDPNLGAERKIKRLKWAGKTREKEQPDSNLNLGWLAGLLAWIATAGRLVLWVGGGLLLLLLAFYLTRFLRGREPLARKGRHIAPTHVRDLDIRPESLPADIGAAALALWERGEHRASLSLLYRGLLSRLAHVHAVPIRDSSTEGECVELARLHLRDEQTRYVSRLVSVWQRAVYGGQDPEGHIVHALCAEFAAALDAPPPGLQPAGQHA